MVSTMSWNSLAVVLVDTDGPLRTNVYCHVWRYEETESWLRQIEHFRRVVSLPLLMLKQILLVLWTFSWLNFFPRIFQGVGSSTVHVTNVPGSLRAASPGHYGNYSNAENRILAHRIQAQTSSRYISILTVNHAQSTVSTLHPFRGRSGGSGFSSTSLNSISS